MANSQEIISGPVELWWAPVGESFPDVDNAPAGNWVLVGLSGDESYTEDGVVITMEDDKEFWTPLGSAIARAVFRTNQRINVGVTMVDMSPEKLRVAWNLLSVTAASGPPITKALDLDLTLTVNELALLIRGTSKSPLLSGTNLQFEVNRVVEMSTHEYTFVKGEPVGVELDFSAMRDSSGNVGQLIVVDS